MEEVINNERRHIPVPLVAIAGQPPLSGDGCFSMGASRSPDGHEIAADSRCLRRDGRPWLPVMGEFHYSRCPEREWRDGLLKMKMGGIDLVATYAFWIHHEEVEDQWEWSGRRSLSEFVRACGDLDLLVVMRGGPWCHGEVRNGGLPDWLLAQQLTPRSDDPAYLRPVRRWYGQIAAQLAGQLWKDGGPVIGLQIENEYDGPAEHLLTLKGIAQEAGLDVPLYTRTGWPELRTPMPPGQLLPLYGGYPDGFWDRSLAEMPPGFGDNFLFRTVRNDASVATDQLGVRDVAAEPDNDYYPYFACEIGGGMMTSYHRRVRIAPRDIEALVLAKLGSGSNLQGYYMYHGGTNPDGRLSTLQESQATGYWNDLPVKTYDFQAPLGEFGQVRPHYHSLRRMHLFLRDFGHMLATMPTRLPETLPVDAADTATLRWAMRTDGRSGFLFVNNSQRLQPMPPKHNVQFELQLSKGDLCVPLEPTDIPADGSFFWPFGLDLAGAHLVHATAQPLCRLADEGTHYVVFAQTDGVPAEFVFDAATVVIETCTGTSTRSGSNIVVRKLQTGTGAALRLRTLDGGHLCLILLDSEQSLMLWKADLGGRERLFLTRATLLTGGETIRLQADDPADLAVSLLPALPVACGGSPLQPAADGLFQRVRAETPSPSLPAVSCDLVRPARPARAVPLGSQGVAEAPGEAEFDGAAVWRLRLPADTDPARDLLLRIFYTGDIARLFLGDELLTDNFYNGSAFEVGLRRYAPDIYREPLTLGILPLRDDAPLYLPRGARPAGAADTPPRIEVIERHEAELTSADTGER